MPPLRQITVDVHAQRATAMQDRRWEKSFAALFDSLLQSLLNSILIGTSHSTNSLRKVSETTNRGFDLAYAFEVGQCIQSLCQIFSEFDVPFSCFRIAALAHELETHPKL